MNRKNESSKSELKVWGQEKYVLWENVAVSITQSSRLYSETARKLGYIEFFHIELS